MRLALKSTLAFAVIYVVVVTGIAVWMVRQLRSAAAEMAHATAQLVGDEVARTLTASALDQLLREDALTMVRLHQIVGDVTQHSSMLTSLAVVDRSGSVIAGDRVEIGRHLALPQVVFGAHNAKPRLLDEPSGGGTFYLLVPLWSDSDLAGYLRLEMRSGPIAALYGRAARQLALVALAGLLAVGAGGLLLHAQLARRNASLTRAIERAVRGDAAGVPHNDEFAEALAAAREVGRELTAVRSERLQAEQRMTALMQAIDVGVIVLQSTLEAVFVNARAIELLGCTSSDDAIVRWNTEVRPRLLSLVPNGNGGHIEVDLPATMATTTSLSLEIYRLGEPGYLVVAKAAEFIAALQNELGLAIQMRGLTRFYAAFAHDLKAPLNAMVMTLELLKLSVQEEPDTPVRQKQGKYLTVLNDEIRRLDRQLRALLSHTAPPSMDRAEVDLRAVLHDLEALLAPQARRQRVTLITAVPDQPVIIVGQRDRLKQALLNIFINALEAMPEGGALSIKLEELEGMAKVAIEDNGPGIPHELLDAIYDMHFSTKNGGTGVGLYVARTVVQSHGGSIQVQSDPDMGTIFTIMLPLAEMVPEAPSATAL